MAESVQAVPRGELPRSEVMQTPEEVTAMLRLKALGWGVRRIAGELEVRAMPRTRSNVSGEHEAEPLILIRARAALAHQQGSLPAESPPKMSPDGNANRYDHSENFEHAHRPDPALDRHRVTRD
jgi:hypothetical protein